MTMCLSRDDHNLVQRLRDLALKQNWGLAVHGSSLAHPTTETDYRDVDLVAVPWTDDACGGLDLILTLMKTEGLTLGNHMPKPAGRYCYLLIRKGAQLTNPDAPKHQAIYSPAMIDISVVDPRPR